MVVAASDNDASRIQRLAAMVKNQGQLRSQSPTCSRPAAAKSAECETFILSSSVVAGVQLAPGWRSQISEAPSGRVGVFISPKGARLKGYKDVLRHLGLPTESQLPAVSPVDNSEQIGSDNAHSTDTATATVSACPASHKLK